MSSSSSSSEDKLDAALDALNNWYDDALKSGMGFKSDEERQEYLKSLGDPEKHPMFATNTDDLVGNPLAEALWAIKEEGKTLIELAEMYKEEGNEWLKKTDKKSYQEAYDRYTHALSFMKKAQVARQQGEETEKDHEKDLNKIYSQIYSNRALASLQLTNYGSCKKDCDLALQLWPENMKAYYRKCKACYLLHDYTTCMQTCQLALTFEPEHVEIRQFLTKSQVELTKREESKAKLYATTWKTLQTQFTETWNICQDLNVALGYPSSIQPEPMQIRAAWPTIQHELQTYTWPVLCLYPQYHHFDVITEVDISSLLVEHLAMMFPEKGDYEQRIDWDEQEEYQASNLVAYVQLDQAAEVKTLLEWLLANLEHHVLVGTGPIDLMKYAIQQLSKEHGTLPLGYQQLLSTIDELSTEKIHQIAEQREKIYQDKLKQIIDKTASSQRPVCKYIEVHLGCTFHQILTTMRKRNIVPRGILSLLVFPRGNKAHKKFLKTLASEHLSIEMMNPQH